MSENAKGEVEQAKREARLMDGPEWAQRVARVLLDALEKAERERDEACGQVNALLEVANEIPGRDRLIMRMAIELQYVQEICPESTSRQVTLCASPEGLACIAEVERLFGPMRGWPELNPHTVARGGVVVDPDGLRKVREQLGADERGEG